LVERVVSLPAALRVKVSRERAEQLWWVAPAGVGLLGLALGLIRLGSQPLSYDEHFSIRAASGSVGAIWHESRRTEAPHLLYYLLLKPWLALFGTSAWVVRLPSAVAGALAAWATALVGARLFGRVAGLGAGIALATSSFFVAWSQSARGYSASTLLAGLATYAFVRAVQERSRRLRLLWAAALVGAAWMNLFALSVLGAHLLALAALRSRTVRRELLPALGLAIAGVAPVVALVATADNGQLDWIPTPTPRLVATGLWDWSSRNPILVLAAVAGAAALVMRVAPRSEGWKALLVCGWAVAPALLTLALSAIQPAFVAQYLLSALPALCLLAGVGLASLRRRPASTLAVVLAAAAAVRLAQHYAGPGTPLRSIF
jgi:mannosyltransferase